MDNDARRHVSKACVVAVIHALTVIAAGYTIAILQAQNPTEEIGLLWFVVYAFDFPVSVGIFPCGFALEALGVQSHDVFNLYFPLVYFGTMGSLQYFVLCLLALRAYERWRARVRSGRNHCVSCDYALHGLESSRCPECGHEVRKGTGLEA